MDNIEDDMSFPHNPQDLPQNNPPIQNLSNTQENNFADIVYPVDDVYDTEDTEDDIVIGNNDSDDDDTPNGYNSRKIQDNNFDKEEEKKRKLKTLLSKYEFAPRAAAAAAPPVTKRSHGGRNSLTDWTENESFSLLQAWGERYSRHGKKSVRSEEWLEVAEKVSEGSKFRRTETQCRNRLDTLKKKYKKEKATMEECAGFSSNWVYFNKMDSILCPKLLVNGNGSVDSKVDPNNLANSSDENHEIKDNLEESGDLEDFPPKRMRVERERGGGDPFKMLADSIDKFSDMYEKIESDKNKKLIELEKMRMDFQRDLELEKKKILMRTQVEIAKIWGLNIEENDLSPGNNVSG